MQKNTRERKVLRRRGRGMGAKEPVGSRSSWRSVNDSLQLSGLFHTTLSPKYSLAKSLILSQLLHSAFSQLPFSHSSFSQLPFSHTALSQLPLSQCSLSAASLTLHSLSCLSHTALSQLSVSQPFCQVERLLKKEIVDMVLGDDEAFVLPEGRELNSTMAKFDALPGWLQILRLL